MNTRNIVVVVAVIIIIIIAASAYVLFTMGPTSTTTMTMSTTTTSTTTTTASTTSTTSTTGTISGVTTITLVAQNIKFNATNPTIYLKVGQTVKFVIINQDSDTTPHNLYIKEIPNDKTSIINPGQTASFTDTFNTAGTYTYACVVHPGLMDGKIVVQG